MAENAFTKNVIGIRFAGKVARCSRGPAKKTIFKFIAVAFPVIVPDSQDSVPEKQFILNKTISNSSSFISIVANAGLYRVIRRLFQLERFHFPAVKSGKLD